MYANGRVCLLQIMIHQPSGGAQGMASDIAIQAEEIIKLRTRYLYRLPTSRAALVLSDRPLTLILTVLRVHTHRLNGLFAKHTGKPLTAIEKAMDRDLFMEPGEAVEFGIIDSIMEKRSLPTSEH